MTIKELLNVKGDFYASLAGRWADEKEYEDINEYKTVIEKSLPQSFRLIKMYKRPFGFTVDTTDGIWKVECKLKGNKILIGAVKK